MSKLQNLSDEDLNRLYNDAKAGIREGTYYSENDGDDTGGWQQADFYTGQMMSSDFTRDQRGDTERELMSLSDLYADNVFDDYGGGHLSEESIRKGFTKVFNEKERRRGLSANAEPVEAASAPAEPKEPFEPDAKSADHLEAENNLASRTYNSVFDRAVAAGRDMTAGDYLRQRNDDKKSGVNRFTHYLKDSNTLAAHESSHAAKNAIKKAGHIGLQPPQLEDPGSLYDKYKADIDSI